VLTLHTECAPTHANVRGHSTQPPPALPPWGVVGISREQVRDRCGQADPTVAGAQGGAAPTAVQHTIHKGALHNWTGLQGSGTLVQAVNLGAKWTGSRGGYRGTIGNTPTRGTAWRYGQAMAGIPWDSLNAKGLYCGNVGYHAIPRDGRTVARHKKALFRRLDRVFGDRGKGCWSGIWVKEFQRRGCVHFHFILYLPYGAPYRSGMHETVREAWLGVTGQDDDLWAFQFAVECSQVQDIRRVKSYQVKYMGKVGRDNAKAYEKVQPAWFKGGGRWWGVVGQSLRRAYVTFRLAGAELAKVKRVMRCYIRAITHGRYTPKSYGRDYSMTVLTRGGDLQVFNDIVRWVTMERLAIAPCAIALPS
jgi:hypothetical protein